MKKYILIVLIGLITSSAVEAKKVDGQIFYESDTVNVTMIIPVKILTNEVDYQRLQCKIKYFDTHGAKKVLMPHDAKEVRFTSGSQRIRMLSRKNTIGIGNFLPSRSLSCRD